MALDFPASSASPFTAPNGVIYTWNTDGYWEARADPSDYLKLDATNGPVTGPLTFESTTTHEGGLAVQNTLVPSTGTTIGSSILNFYEEGIWTPIVTEKTNGFKNSGGPNAGWDSVTTIAKYARIGNICFLRLSFNGMDNSSTSGITPNSSSMKIVGLPFPLENSSARTALTANINNNGANSAVLSAYINRSGGNGEAQIYLTGTATSNSGLIYPVVGTSNRILITGFYPIDGASTLTIMDENDGGDN